MPGLGEALKLERLFRSQATTIFTRLAHAAIRDLIQEVARLNERLLRSRRVRPRVGYKIRQLEEVLASLRSQKVQARGDNLWSVTAVEREAES